MQSELSVVLLLFCLSVCPSVCRYTCYTAELAAGREKKFGLAAVDFAKPPEEKEIRPSRRFSAGLADDGHREWVNLTFSAAEKLRELIIIN